MKEIEVKILEINRLGFENKIIILGGEKIFDGEIKGIFFENEQLGKEKLLRLRKEENKCVLTLKDVISKDGAKVADEYEVEVSDYEIAKKIFEELGYSIKKNIRKHRTEYAVDGVKFAFDKYFDEYAFIPEFLEIEAEDQETLFRYVKLLGLEKEDCKPWSGGDVIKYYKDKI